MMDFGLCIWFRDYLSGQAVGRVGSGRREGEVCLVAHNIVHNINDVGAYNYKNILHHIKKLFVEGDRHTTRHTTDRQLRLYTFARAKVKTRQGEIIQV